MTQVGNSKGWTFDAYDTYLQSQLASMDKATGIALTEAKDAKKEHNGLIDKMEKQNATFITRKEFYGALIGFTGLIAALFTILEKMG